MTQNFVHLRVHSEYSLVDGLVRIKGLVKSAAELRMPAVALTDFCNFYGLVKFYKAAQGAGVKPIVGADLLVVSEQPDVPPALLTLLVQNDEGYRNLTRLISRAYLEGQQQGKPMVERAWIAEAASGRV